MWQMWNKMNEIDKGFLFLEIAYRENERRPPSHFRVTHDFVWAMWS